MRYLIASLFALSLLSAAENKLGKPLTVKEPMTLAALLAHPDDYVGKTVQVQGRIVEVCQMMGCWLDLTDGEIVFPKDSPGKSVIAEGKFTKIDLTKEQAIERAKEEAQDKGVKFDPATVKGPVTIYQLQGSGAVIN